MMPIIGSSIRDVMVLNNKPILVQLFYTLNVGFVNFESSATY